MAGLVSQPLDDASLDQLFRNARTFSTYLDKEVSDAQIHAIWDLMKMGPTSANQMPARLVWCKSDDARERLARHASPGNKDKIRNAPLCVIAAMDLDFHEQLPWLYPHTDAKSWFLDGKGRKTSAFRNASLQGAYLILAARALGLDCGPCPASTMQLSMPNSCPMLHNGNQTSSAPSDTERATACTPAARGLILPLSTASSDRP